MQTHSFQFYDFTPDVHLTAGTCVLKYRVRDPVHLQLTLKVGGAGAEGSGSVRLGRGPEEAERQKKN